jgi:hypothetical protein
MHLHPEIVVPVVAVAVLWGVSTFAKGIARKPVPRVPGRLIAAAALGVGLALCLWGGHAFMWAEPSMPAVSTGEDGEPAFRIDAPSVGELAEEFGVGLAVRKTACLAVAAAGLLIAGGSLPSLTLRKDQP